MASRLRASAAAAALILVCPIVNWPTDPDSEIGLARVLFWGCLLSCITAGVVFLVTLGASLRARVAAWRPALLAVLYCAACAATAPLACPPDLRVQFDESSIVSVSHNIWVHQAAMVTVSALPGAGMAHGVEMAVDKRPPLLSLLAAALHGIRGYSVAHVNWINIAALFVGMTALFQFVRHRLNLPAALSAPWCLLCVPLTSVSATSAGLETLSTVCLMFLVLTSWRFVMSPSSTTFSGMIATALVYSWTRYEALPIAITLVSMAFIVKRQRVAITSIARVLPVLAVALVVPLVMLLVHSQQGKFYPESGEGPLWSAALFMRHATELVSQMLEGSSSNLFPGPWVCLAALVAWAYRWRRRCARREELLLFGGVALPTVIALSWFYGDASEPSAARLFLPIAWMCALSPLLFFDAIPRRTHAFLAIAIALFGATRLVSAPAGAAALQGPITNVLHGVKLAIERLSFDSATTLYVGAPAQHLIIMGFAAVSPAAFVRRREDIARLADSGDVRQVVLLETGIDDLLAKNSGRARDLLQMYRWELMERSPRTSGLATYRLRR